MSVESLAADVASEHDDKLRDADQLLREIKLADRPPNYQELVFFRQQVGWNETQVKEQLRRMHSVLRFEAIAGTPENREAAKVEAAKAKEVYDKEVPKVQAQLEKLEAKLRQLETDKRVSSTRIEQQTEAVEKLRELAPEHIAAEVNQRRGLIKSTLGRELLDKKSRAIEIESCLDPSKHANPKMHIEAVRRSCREAVAEIVRGRDEGYQSLSYAFSDKWPSIRAAMENELAELQPQIDELQTQLDAELSALKNSLDFYGQGN